MDSYLRPRTCARAEANLMFLDQTHLTVFFLVDDAFWPLYERDVVARVRANPRASTYLHQVGGNRLFVDIDGPDDPRLVAAAALALLPGPPPGFAYARNPGSGRSHLVIDHPCDAAERVALLEQLAITFPVDVRCSSLRLPFSRKRAYQHASDVYDRIYNERGEELEGVEALRRMSTYR